jgi:nucleotidyltransferase substrate binding protein (TIGR01987 family)
MLHHFPIMAISTSELKKALATLQNAIKLQKTDITRDAAIQRFEFTFELAWKTAKKKMGSASSAPRVVIREMAQAQLIDDPATWFEFLEARNLSSHTYKEEIAERVFEQAKKFSIQCENFLKRLESLP